MGAGDWAVIHAERRALADDLASLTDEQWATRSLCADWTVHQMLGHIVATAKMTPPQFIAKMAAAGFNFTRFSARNVDYETRSGPIATLAEFRAHLEDTSTPPGPMDSWVGEIVIHGADIRRPLGIDHRYPTDTVVQVANFYQKSNLLVGAKKRIAGLALRASDTDWSHGSGPEVIGPILSLVQAMTGRAVALADLSGDGVALLRSRSG